MGWNGFQKISKMEAVERPKPAQLEEEGILNGNFRKEQTNERGNLIKKYIKITFFNIFLINF